MTNFGIYGLKSYIHLGSIGNQLLADLAVFEWIDGGLAMFGGNNDQSIIVKIFGLKHFHNLSQ